MTERGLAPTRAKAQALVMAGKVQVGGVRADKPGTQVTAEADIQLVGMGPSYVSRGGEKLAGALLAFARFGFDPNGKIAADIGASTGGFTDCLLQHGAARVFAIDVGFGLLHEKLRADDRVVVMERVNARDLNLEMIGGSVDLVVVDASFIGLGKLLDGVVRVLRQGGELVALIKPQFEAGKREVSKGHGVIRDEAVRAEAISQVLDQVRASGLEVVADAPCVIRGPKGNLEHFVYARRPAAKHIQPMMEGRGTGIARPGTPRS